MKEKSNFSAQKSWWWEKSNDPDIMLNALRFPLLLSLIFFHQNLINNFQLNGFSFLLAHRNDEKFLITNSLRLIKQKFFLFPIAQRPPLVTHWDIKFYRIRRNLIFARFQMPLHHQQSTTHCELIGKSTQGDEKKLLKRANVHRKILQSCWSRKNSGSMKILQQSFKIKFSNSHSQTHARIL